jgi:PKD domain
MSNSLKSVIAGGLAILAISAAGAAAHAQTEPVYPGGTPQSAAIAIHSSGSGVITADTSHAYAGGGSLKLVTHGLYQGGAITLNSPYNLGPLLSNKNAYLQFAFQPPAAASTTGGPGGLGGKFGNGMKGMGGPPGMNTGGSAGSLFGGGGKGATQSGSAASTRFNAADDLKNLRIVFVTTGGAAIEKKLPVSYATEDAGWKLLSVPVSAFGFSDSDAKIKEVRIYGDTTGTLYIGKIAPVIDTTRIMITPIEEKVVTANSKYRYTASATGGVSPLIYTWDWDDRDGIQVDAEGRSASHMYRRSGDYKVTVTVSDPFGVKAAVSTKFNIHVP